MEKGGGGGGGGEKVVQGWRGALNMTIYPIHGTIGTPFKIAPIYIYIITFKVERGNSLFIHFGKVHQS